LEGAELKDLSVDDDDEETVPLSKGNFFFLQQAYCGRLIIGSMIVIINAYVITRYRAIETLLFTSTFRYVCIIEKTLESSSV
jgi:hypothetical protein